MLVTEKYKYFNYQTFITLILLVCKRIFYSSMKKGWILFDIKDYRDKSLNTFQRVLLKKCIYLH